MKTKLTYLVLAFSAAIFFTACDPEEVLDQLTTVTINTDLPQSFSVSVPEGGHLVDITIAKTIKGSSNDQIAQFESKIDSYSVDSLHLEITNYVGAETINLDGATLGFKNAASEEVVAPITLVNGDTKINLHTASTAGEPLVYYFDPAIAEAVADSFLEENEITIEVTASVDGSPATFDIKATLFVQVTGKLMKMESNQ